MEDAALDAVYDFNVVISLICDVNVLECIYIPLCTQVIVSNFDCVCAYLFHDDPSTSSLHDVVLFSAS